MALTTKLQAVNQMLAHIGEAPVNAIGSSATNLPITATTAEATLDEISKEVQMMTWHFNTIEDEELTPAANNTITLPADTLFVDFKDTTKDIIQRGLTLYDRKNKTTTFETVIKVNRTIELPWDSLSEQARRYITLRASRIFQSRLIGSRELEQLILRDEISALAQLQEVDSDSSDRTILDSFDVAVRVGVNRNYRVL